MSSRSYPSSGSSSRSSTYTPNTSLFSGSSGYQRPIVHNKSERCDDGFSRSKKNDTRYHKESFYEPKSNDRRTYTGSPSRR
ncbi:hypothetical protein ABVK25_010452 [Lepraria finkii]|uniref:Uncharacterized protein n=1 Tax=Lepraria finkii TaxID=1340010 RepID=A0ABR4AUA6_9LECA